MKKIKLTNCDKYALVDDEDEFVVEGFKNWYLLETYGKMYAASSARVEGHGFVPLMNLKEVAEKRGRGYSNHFNAAHLYRVENPKVSVLMHRIIMNPTTGMEIDHINGDGLDNRKCNLRVCTREENSRNRKLSSINTTGFHGVSISKKEKVNRKKKFTASIRIGKGKRLNLGRYYTASEAAHVYDEAAKKHHGVYATLNYPETKIDNPTTNT